MKHPTMNQLAVAARLPVGYIDGSLAVGLMPPKAPCARCTSPSGHCICTPPRTREQEWEPAFQLQPSPTPPEGSIKATPAAQEPPADALGAASSHHAAAAQSPQEASAGAVLACLELPWPNSANTHWRSMNLPNGTPVKYISEAGKRFRKAVVEACLLQRAPRNISGLLAVTVECWLPDRRVRDLDNLLKPSFDSLKTPKRPKEVMAGVVEDDTQFRDVRIVERGYAPPGRVRVTIRRFIPGA